MLEEANRWQTGRPAALVDTGRGDVPLIYLALLAEPERAHRHEALRPPMLAASVQ